MIRVAAPGEPATFAKECRDKGQAWVLKHPKATRGETKLPSYWSEFLEDLDVGFSGLCGYAAMHNSSGGTVDHYISKETDESKAYEWDNYRFASGLMNNMKRRKDAKVLDPFEIQNGWFEIILPSLQMQLTAVVPGAYKTRAEFTLKELGLQDDERVIKWRRSWYEMYENKELTLEGLRRKAPLIAAAIDRRIADGAAR